jgi:nitrogen regulatory protein PII-like uncharacterized protein
MGQPGCGKTYSLRELDPKETFYIDADGKGLNWKGWRNQYNAKAKNYYKSDDPKTILKLLDDINENAKTIKTVIVDTVNGCMIADEMRRMQEKGYDKWMDLAQSVYYIVKNSSLYRDDLVVVLMFHVQVEEDGFQHILTNGRKLNKIQLETMLNNVFLAKRGDSGFVFETTAHNSTAKTYAGAFDKEEIPNNMKDVIEALKEF